MMYFFHRIKFIILKYLLLEKLLALFMVFLMVAFVVNVIKNPAGAYIPDFSQDFVSPGLSDAPIAPKLDPDRPKIIISHIQIPKGYLQVVGRPVPAPVVEPAISLPLRLTLLGLSVGIVATAALISFLLEG
jgi:hypothetical protein